LVKISNLQTLGSQLQLFGGDVGSLESRHYSEGFGTGLLVKLPLPLTRWLPGVARTVSL
jgi:hypothetical protein